MLSLPVYNHCVLIQYMLLMQVSVYFIVKECKGFFSVDNEIMNY